MIRSLQNRQASIFIVWIKMYLNWHHWNKIKTILTFLDLQLKRVRQIQQWAISVISDLSAGWDNEDGPLVSVKLFYREPLPVDTSFTNKPVPVCVLSTLKIIFCLSQHFHHKIGARPNSHLSVDTDPLRSDKPLPLSWWQLWSRAALGPPPIHP